MAKANQRFRAGHTYHKIEGDYKIPFEDRQKFMNKNVKWVNKKTYQKYIKWRKENE